MTILLLTLVVRSQNQDFKIKGVWRCYTAIADTLETDVSGMWLAFDNDTMQAVLTPGYGFSTAGNKEKYVYKNNILTTYAKDGKSSVKVTVYTKNFISYSTKIDNETQTVFLKRETKSR